MKIEYRKATVTDAELLIKIYNASFYSDYMKLVAYVLSHCFKAKESAHRQLNL